VRSRKHIRLVNLRTDMLFARIFFMEGPFSFLTSPVVKSVRFLTLNRCTTGGLAISADHKSLLISQEKLLEASIVLVKNFHWIADVGLVIAGARQLVMSDNRYSVYRMNGAAFNPRRPLPSHESQHSPTKNRGSRDLPQSRAVQRVGTRLDRSQRQPCPSARRCHHFPYLHSGDRAVNVSRLH
jgi:hypothetical protein